MIRLNENYAKLKASYLFADIARRVGAYVAANPQKPVIRLGIGDVTEPLPPVCVEALHAAADEMGGRATFRGYGPEQGYAFLREAIAQHDYAARGCEVAPDEVFVSDGAKCDVGNFQELFAGDIRLAFLVRSDDRGASRPRPASHVPVAGGPDHWHGEQGAGGGAD